MRAGGIVIPTEECRARLSFPKCNRTRGPDRNRRGASRLLQVGKELGITAEQLGPTRGVIPGREVGTNTIIGDTISNPLEFAPDKLEGDKEGCRWWAISDSRLSAAIGMYEWGPGGVGIYGYFQQHREVNGSRDLEFVSFSRGRR